MRVHPIILCVALFGCSSSPRQANTAAESKAARPSASAHVTGRGARPSSEREKASISAAEGISGSQTGPTQIGAAIDRLVKQMIGEATEKDTVISVRDPQNRTGSMIDTRALKDGIGQQLLESRVKVASDPSKLKPMLDELERADEVGGTRKMGGWIAPTHLLYLTISSVRLRIKTKARIEYRVTLTLDNIATAQAVFKKSETFQQIEK